MQAISSTALSHNEKENTEYIQTSHKLLDFTL